MKRYYEGRAGIALDFIEKSHEGKDKSLLYQSLLKFYKAFGACSIKVEDLLAFRF